MSQQLQVFNFRGNDLRIKIIEGEPWFVITDACKVLEIANVGNAISRLDGDGVRLADTIDSLGRAQNVAFANEPNLYRLIFRSDKPEAKPFQDWVYNDVLPAIRKTGSYGIPGLQPEQVKALEIIEAQRYELKILRRSIVASVPRQLSAPRITKSQLPLQEHVLQVIQRRQEKNCTLRDLGRAITKSTPEEIETAVNEHLKEGTIREEAKTGHGTHYRPA